MTVLERWVADQVRGRTLAVVGVGNRLRGDDAAGPCVVDLLLAHPGFERHAPGVHVLDAGEVPENFLGTLLAWHPEVVLFVDVTDHGAPPGAWCIVPPDALDVASSSTHTPSLALLAGLLAEHGATCWLLGIQPHVLQLGAGLSRAVAAAVAEVARALAQALASEVSHA